MQFHVAQNGEKTGPFEREEVLRRLVAGELKGSDLGWHEGLADWEPLSKLIPPPAKAQATVLPQSSGMAIASLVCGILGFVTFGLGSIPAIITGHMARSRINKSAGALGGNGFALAGLILGYLCLVLTFVAILASLAVPAFSRIQQKAVQAKTMSQAKQIVIGMKQYAAEHDGSLPPSLETLVEAQHVDPSLLPQSFRPQTKNSNDCAQGWDYRGAGMKNPADGKTIVLVSHKADRAKKKIVARLDGSVELVPESEVP
jgi:type II secretory pathway pseudopilin PulG